MIATATYSPADEAGPLCPGCGQPRAGHPIPGDGDDRCVHGRPLCTRCSECPGGIVTRELAVLGS